MADEIEDNDSSDAPNSTEEHMSLLETPRKRADFVLPPRKKLKYGDGSPANPLKSIKGLVKKVQTNKYSFPSLAEGDDIRVLIVEPGKPERNGIKADPVRCRLVPSALPSTQELPHGRHVIPYEALSYYWGLEEPTIPIFITGYNTGSLNPRPSMANIVQKKFWIRPNLHAALVQLRHQQYEVTLWVDALCIDQDNISEKTIQVSRMHEIYSEATNICIWLGVGEIDPESTHRTFEFIREMLSLKRLDQLVMNQRHADRWLAFVELMRNRWFSRRWVVQELALAKAATVHYGGEAIMWKDFADAVALFVTKHDQINALLRKHVAEEPDPIGDMRALGANSLVEATSNLFRKSNDGKVLERLMSLEILVSTLLAFEASDPRDTVYAMLSIANDTPYSNSKTAAETVASAAPTPTSVANAGDHRIIPNYQKTLPEVCIDFVDYCVDKSQSLDIICRHWAPVGPKERRRSFTSFSTKVPPAMPTWISLITGSAFGGPEVALHGRCNGDSLVGTPSRQNHKNYNASAGLLPKYRIERVEKEDTTNITQEEAIPSNMVQGGLSRGSDTTPPNLQETPKKSSAMLFVKGICIDTIESLSPRAAQGMILQECLEMGGWSDEDDNAKVPDSLWRTLVADRGPNGTSAPSWYHRACLECFTHVTQNGDLSTGALMENPNTPSTMVTFLKRVQEVVWNRKFLRSKGGAPRETDEKLFGLAPTNASEGDFICILYGCSVPVILRKMTIETKGKPLENFYYFIGEAYVHGMMDGEAVSKQLPLWPYDDFEEFNIR